MFIFKHARLKASMSQRCRSEISWFANKNHPINGVAAVQSRDWKRSWPEFNAYKSSVAQSCDKAHGPISSLNRPRSFHQTRRLTFAGIFPMHVTCQMSCPASRRMSNGEATSVVEGSLAAEGSNWPGTGPCVPSHDCATLNLRAPSPNRFSPVTLPDNCASN